MSITRVSSNMLAYDGGAFGFRNKIINGDMRVAQRGVSFTPTLGSIFYTLDRWAVYALGAAPVVTQGSGDGSQFGRSLDIAGVAGNTVVTVVQRIESANCLELAGQTVSVRMRVFSTSASSMTAVMLTASAADNFTSATTINSQVISLSVGWNDVSYTVALSSGAPANGLQLELQFGSVVAGAARRLTGVQVEAGSTSTPFEMRPIGMEIGLCQRYYCEVLVTPTATSIYAYTYMPVTMRVAPAIVLKSGALNGATYINHASSLNIIRQNTNATSATDATLSCTSEL